MTQEVFKLQVHRLVETYGERYYPPERVKLIFNAVKKLPDGWLENTVSQFIGNNRHAPMLKEFLKEAWDYEKRARQESVFNNFGSVTELLHVAADRAPNREFAKECVKLLEKRQKKMIDESQFKEGCDLLDEAAQILSGKVVHMRGREQ